MPQGPDATRALLDEQQAYYRTRAPEYDEYFLRRGRYDEGPEQNAKWFAEIEVVKTALDAFAPVGDVLELAAGTGLWTPQLSKHAARLTALDGSPEVLAINRTRVPSSAAVEYVASDIFTWHPERSYDAVFFGFWLSHVPAELFETFWQRVRSFLRPGGRVFFVDSLHPATAAAGTTPRAGQISQRRLNDGREFQVVKIYYQPAALQQRLASLGWSVEVHSTPHYCVYGSATRAETD